MSKGAEIAAINERNCPKSWYGKALVTSEGTPMGAV